MISRSVTCRDPLCSMSFLLLLRSCQRISPRQISFVTFRTMLTLYCEGLLVLRQISYLENYFFLAVCDYLLRRPVLNSCIWKPYPLALTWGSTIKVKVRFFPVFKKASRHDDALGSGGIAPRILNLGIRWSWVVTFRPLPLYHRDKSPRHPLWLQSERSG
jgi:hypothetical protein